MEQRHCRRGGVQAGRRARAYPELKRQWRGAEGTSGEGGGGGGCEERGGGGDVAGTVLGMLRPEDQGDRWRRCDGGWAGGGNAEKCAQQGRSRAMEEQQRRALDDARTTALWAAQEVG